MKTMIQAIFTMEGKTLFKELLDLHLPVTQSAFVQRRYQIKHQLFTRKIKRSLFLQMGHRDQYS